MKVYIVSNGQYDDYSICHVFASREIAQAYIDNELESIWQSQLPFATKEYWDNWVKNYPQPVKYRYEEGELERLAEMSFKSAIATVSDKNKFLENWNDYYIEEFEVLEKLP